MQFSVLVLVLSVPGMCAQSVCLTGVDEQTSDGGAGDCRL